MHNLVHHIFNFATEKKKKRNIGVPKVVNKLTAQDIYK